MTENFIARCREEREKGGALVAWEWRVGDGLYDPHSEQRGSVVSVLPDRVRVALDDALMIASFAGEDLASCFPLPSLERMVAELEAAGWFMHTVQRWGLTWACEGRGNIDRMDAEPFADFTLRAYCAMRKEKNGGEEEG